MHPLAETLERAAAAWRDRGWPAPRAVVVSGSGLAVDLFPPLAGPWPLGELLPFPVHAVAGHPLAVEVFEALAGTPVLYLRGRLHTYQGYDAHQAVFPLRLAARLGARTLLMTNASGGVRPSLRAGQLVLLADHLNLSGMNPLRGELPPEWGPRFPDMAGAYDPELRRGARAAAAELGLEVAEGVYAGLAGPSYETPAEVRMLAALGADLVGMSTVLETIAARQLGLRVLCLSLVTNVSGAVGTDHQEVLDAGRVAAGHVREILRRLLLDPATYGEPPAPAPHRSGG